MSRAIELATQIIENLFTPVDESSDMDLTPGQRRSANAFVRKFAISEVNSHIVGRRAEMLNNARTEYGAFFAYEKKASREEINDINEYEPSDIDDIAHQAIKAGWDAWSRQ